MALDFGTLHAELPVRLQIGDGDLVEIGTVTLTSTTRHGETIVDKAPLATLLRETADEMINPTEGDSAAP